MHRGLTESIDLVQLRGAFVHGTDVPLRPEGVEAHGERGAGLPTTVLASPIEPLVELEAATPLQAPQRVIELGDRHARVRPEDVEIGLERRVERDARCAARHRVRPEMVPDRRQSLGERVSAQMPRHARPQEVGEEFARNGPAAGLERQVDQQRQLLPSAERPRQAAAITEFGGTEELEAIRRCHSRLPLGRYGRPPTSTVIQHLRTA